MCTAVLTPGVLHICPNESRPNTLTTSASSERNGIGAYLKMFLPFILALLLQLGTAVWWAAGVQNELRQVQEKQTQQESYFKEQLARQQQIIDRLDSYFRRPPPQ